MTGGIFARSNAPDRASSVDRRQSTRGQLRVVPYVRHRPPQLRRRRAGMVPEADVGSDPHRVELRGGRGLALRGFALA
eukprot:CAMPEP_0180166276 /NCGR_PEP_ID=MMETSP0986-20121125/31470_1 /TAXON_ID=697907 /ORGANISM="non described non described, Strain CCMP2293" /LENGTH=77 /DNA_ID=CAMNT_0022117415 /DNA_START=75 /DNA_END=304 /DNA_ORIENTATION=-